MRELFSVVAGVIVVIFASSYVCASPSDDAKKFLEVRMAEASKELAKLPAQEIFDCHGVSDMNVRLTDVSDKGNYFSRMRVLGIWKKALDSKLEAEPSIYAGLFRNSGATKIIMNPEGDGEDVRAYLIEHDPVCRQKLRSAFNVVRDRDMLRRSKVGK